MTRHPTQRIKNVIKTVRSKMNQKYWWQDNEITDYNVPKTLHCYTDYRKAGLPIYDLAECIAKQLVNHFGKNKYLCSTFIEMRKDLLRGRWSAYKLRHWITIYERPNSRYNTGYYWWNTEPQTCKSLKDMSRLHLLLFRCKIVWGNRRYSQGFTTVPSSGQLVHAVVWKDGSG